MHRAAQFIKVHSKSWYAWFWNFRTALLLWSLLLLMNKNLHRAVITGNNSRSDVYSYTHGQMCILPVWLLSTTEPLPLLWSPSLQCHSSPVGLFEQAQPMGDLDQWPAEARTHENIKSTGCATFPSAYTVYPTQKMCVKLFKHNRKVKTSWWNKSRFKSSGCFVRPLGSNSL